MLKSSSVDQIYDIVKERIVSLQLKLGEKIHVQKLKDKESGVKTNMNLKGLHYVS